MKASFHLFLKKKIRLVSSLFMLSQDALYDYLKERNIDDDLAAFICMYADQKEQTEYTNWLGEMSKFVK